MLNIAKTIYAAMNATGHRYELPEAELIPLGTTTTEKKKLATITQKYSVINEHENIPLPGFTLYKADRKSWGSIDQTWLVIDPRGFLVRISGQNLENILHVTGITEGLIQEKCIWARQNSETRLTLIPVTSAKFNEAVGNTALMENKVEITDVQIGDTVLLQSKLTGIYMGVASLYGQLTLSTGIGYKVDTYPRRQIIELSPGRYHFGSDLKILKVINKTPNPLTREQAIESMNVDINDGVGTFAVSTYTGANNDIKHVSAHSVPKVSLSFEEITKDEATIIFRAARTEVDIGILLLEDASCNRFLVDFPYSAHSLSTISVDSFDRLAVVNLLNLEPCEKLILTDRRRTIWSTNNHPGLHSLDNFTKFYKIVKHVRKNTYI